MFYKSLRRSGPTIVAIVLTTFVCAEAHAQGKAKPRPIPQAYYGTETSLAPFIWRFQHMTAGTEYTIETRNLSRGDTVMYLIDWTAGIQVAANDDWRPGTLASRIVYTPSVSGPYLIWVWAGRGGSGSADLYINEAPKLIQNPFGGQLAKVSARTDTELRVVGTKRSMANDFMLILLDRHKEYMEYDDNSGAATYPYLRPSREGGEHAVYGCYPGSAGAGRLIMQEVPDGPAHDRDGDGVTDGLEDRVGSSMHHTDSDDDGIPDDVELFGGDDNYDWSFSEDASPVRKNIYVEVDYMVRGAPVIEVGGRIVNRARRPYDGLPADVARIFADEGDIDVTVIIDSDVGWVERLSRGHCGVRDCVSLDELKEHHFSQGYPERRPYFHYAIFGHRFEWNGRCNGGEADLPGQDFAYARCDQAEDGTELFEAGLTPEQQRGVFLHELGHNLNLTHNGNGNEQDGRRSTIHKSVMNYDYDTTYEHLLARGFAYYSHGGCYMEKPGTCVDGCVADCKTSPKGMCIDQGDACTSACDCDLDEWAALDLPIIGSEYASSLGSLDDSGAGDRDEPSADPHRKDRSRAPRRQARRVPPDERRAQVEALVERHEARGRRRGVDFRVADEGDAVFATCE